ncbi:hypothetical protein [Mycobacterium botniense]|uniref:Uncharacterized protein n=1 Tax=Mycobacterium botniense TaxID=84962 RepID=A0A7I9XTJ1_9MYCO|nr:hypothetical protein [Mycobacterium botniense]GFG73329.1 hypothetical protein MBOT_06940 [Mycobacterium botniense]
MSPPIESPGSPRETYNPWTIVNLVFKHLAEQGLRPVLGERDPAGPAASLLSALGITPSMADDAWVRQRRDTELAELRARLFPGIVSD